MKLLLLLITLFAFLQSAFLEVNLVLITLIARSLVVDDEHSSSSNKDNLWLAFFGGLILSFLSQVNLGYWPLVLILVVKLAQLFKRVPVSFNALMVLLSGGILVAIASALSMFFIDQEFKISRFILESILVVPAFYLIRIWEDRFVVKSGIKLKV